jgi:hypothetical protein
VRGGDHSRNHTKEQWVDKLTTADKVIFGSAIVFLISLFLPWYGIEEFGFEYNNSGADYFLTGWLPLLLAIVMVAQVAISRFSPDTKLPDPPMPWGQIHMILGIVILVLLVLRLLIASDDVGGFDADVDLDRKYGLFLALLAAIGLAVGGFLKRQEGEVDTTTPSGPATPF